VGISPAGVTMADVTPASFQSWRKEQTTKATKTLNEYLAMLSTF
jgi:hypothetical protein